MFECHYTMEELASLSETGSDQLTCAELAGYLYNARKEIERLQGLLERAKPFVEKLSHVLNPQSELVEPVLQLLKDVGGGE